MNIRGTDPTALTAVTDLILPLAAARNEAGKEFERALQPAPSPRSTAESAPVRPRREDAAPSATNQPPANSAAEDQESSARDTADNPTEPAGPKPRRSDVAEPTEQSGEAPVCIAPESTDEEQSDRELPVSVQLAQVIAAAQQLPREQQVKELQPVNATQDSHTEVQKAAVELQPISQVPENPIAPPLIDQSVVVHPAPIGEATAANAEELKAAGLVVAELTGPSAADATDPKLLVTPASPQPHTASPPPPRAPHNAAPVNNVPAPQQNGGSPAANHSVQKQPNLPGAAAATESPTAANSASPAENSPREDQESADDPPGTQRLIAGMVQEVGTAGPAAAHEAPTTPTTDNLPPTEAPPPAPPPEAGSIAGATPNQAGSASQPNSTINPAAAIIQRLPAHALVRNTTEPQPDGMPVPIDSARFLQRVARAFESARERGGEIRLRLSPPELGALRVEVTMQEQGLVARLEVETPEARAALMENLPLLRERLAEQNLRLERFDVDLSQRESSQRDGGFAEQQPERQAHSQARQPRISTNRQPVPQAVTNQVATPAGMQERRLNVIV